MTEVEGELVTPTGAAIVAAVKTKDKLPETFEIQKIGIGAGKRQYECPGILRAMFISESTEQAKGRNPKAENQEIKDTMLHYGAVNAMMSGSGPTVFGLFDDRAKAKAAYSRLRGGSIAKEVFLTRFFHNRAEV